jgi:hypothetical protein
MFAWLIRCSLVASFIASPAMATIYAGKNNTDQELSEALFCLNYFLWDFPNSAESLKGLVAVQRDLETLIGEREPEHVAEMFVLYARDIKQKPEPSDFARLLCENHYLGRPPGESNSN